MIIMPVLPDILLMDQRSVVSEASGEGDLLFM